MSNRFLPVADMADFEAKQQIVADELGLAVWSGSPVPDFAGRWYLVVPPESSLYASAMEALPAAPGITSYLVRLTNGVAQEPMPVGPAEIEALKYDSNATFIKGDYLNRMAALAMLGVDTTAIQQYIAAKNWQEPAAPIGWVLILEYGGDIRVKPVYDLEHRYTIINKLLHADPKEELLYVVSEADCILAYNTFKLLNDMGADWNLQPIVKLIHRINPNWTPS